MNALEMLKLGGCANTTKGRAEFHKKYPTPEHFFAKHGGQLSGAPYNGQPTAAEFFAWGQPIVGPQGFYGDGGPTKNNIGNYGQSWESIKNTPVKGMTSEDALSFIRNMMAETRVHGAKKFPLTEKMFDMDPREKDKILIYSMFKDPRTMDIILKDTYNENHMSPSKRRKLVIENGYEHGGDVEYNRALALVTKAMGGQAGVEMRSTDDYLQNENGYLTDYLNQGQQQFMQYGGNLRKFVGGGDDDSSSDDNGRGGPGSLNPTQGETHEEWSRRNGIPGGGFNGGNMANLKWDGRMWSNGYNNQTENQNNYSDGRERANAAGLRLDSSSNNNGSSGSENNQNYNPHLVNQHSFTNGQSPYMGIFNTFANMVGNKERQSFVQPKLKIKNKMYGDINYYGDQGASGQKSGDSSKQGQNITAQNNNPEGYTRYDEIIKRGIWNRLAPNKFAPKHVRTGWEKTGQDKGTNDINPAIGGTGSGSKTASNSAQSNSENAKKLYDEATARQNYIPTTPYMTNQAPSPMGPFQPSISPFIKPYEGTQPSMGPAAKSPFSSGFPGRAMGPGYAYGGVPQFVGGGTGMYNPHPDDVSNIYGGIGFNWDAINPWQVEGVAQDVTGFLNNGQNQRIMNAQRERLQNPLSTDADLEYKGNQRTLDSNLVSNTLKTGQSVNFAGESNVDGQIGMTRYGGTMQGGGAVEFNIDDVIDIDDDQLEQFLANGGQVEYL